MNFGDAISAISTELKHQEETIQNWYKDDLHKALYASGRCRAVVKKISESCPVEDVEKAIVSTIASLMRILKEIENN